MGSTWEACPKAPQVSFNQTFLLHRTSHSRTPLATPPRAEPMPSLQTAPKSLPTSAPLCHPLHQPHCAHPASTLPLQPSSQNEQLSSPPLPCDRFIGSPAGPGRPSGLCPCPSHLADPIPSAAWVPATLAPGALFPPPSPLIKSLQILLSSETSSLTLPVPSNPMTCLHSPLLPPLNPYHGL